VKGKTFIVARTLGRNLRQNMKLHIYLK